MRATYLWILPFLLSACDGAWNDPYPASDRQLQGGNILYTAFTDRPKHLDPVQSYSEDEITFTAQIYEPPLQYHYLKRPYELIPATAVAIPRPRYLDAQGRVLPDTTPASRIAFSEYVVQLRPGILYQPHPAFAEQSAKLSRVTTLADFSNQGTRELTADDYVYGIKRLAHPRLHSPVFGLMSEYVVGLSDLEKRLRSIRNSEWLDLRPHVLDGVVALDRYRYRIRIKGKYPQFLYWLTMPFFAPIPWEADRFYSQPGMAEKNLTLDWYPIGTGPYMLTENNPNARMVLMRNPNFRVETYPCEGEPEDRAAGLLKDCGRPLPFIDKVVFTREKEQIPYWNKFLQGYYDASGISSDSFDQAVQVGVTGDASLTEDMQRQGIVLSTSVATSTMYMGFNMLDPVVGGSGERARKLRQAISIAIDQEEFISIFQNGRGIAAQGPIPPGIFGHSEGEINPVVYDGQAGQARRKDVDTARRLLSEAGYPNGRDRMTGEPLVINMDTTGTGLGAKSRIDWLNKQFRKINVELNVRSTDYNRFQEKIRKGAVQLFYFGWNADYPDPENFFFLLYGPQGKVHHSGENAANYFNPEYDKLFDQMRAMENSPARATIIAQMMRILRHDAPWIWGFHPKDYTLRHAWLFNRKPTKVGNNTLKYQRIDATRRAQLRREWNPPVLWPLILMILLGGGVMLSAWRSHRCREQAEIIVDGQIS